MGGRRTRTMRRLAEHGAPYLPHADADEDDFIGPVSPPVIDGWHAELHVRFKEHRGRFVDWSIGLWVHQNGLDHVIIEGDPAPRFCVERIDTCDSEIHRHRFARSRPDDRQGDRHPIRVLQAGDEAIVDSEYAQQHAWMFNNWESCVRRWNDA